MTVILNYFIMTIINTTTITTSFCRTVQVRKSTKRHTKRYEPKERTKLPIDFRYSPLQDRVNTAAAASRLLHPPPPPIPLFFRHSSERPVPFLETLSLGINPSLPRAYTQLPGILVSDHDHQHSRTAWTTLVRFPSPTWLISALVSTNDMKYILLVEDRRNVYVYNISGYFELVTFRRSWLLLSQLDHRCAAAEFPCWSTNPADDQAAKE